jgi:opacity protein-like surface antigen
MKKISIISALIGTSNVALAGFYAGGSVNINQNKYSANGLAAEPSSFSKKMSRLHGVDSVVLVNIALNYSQDEEQYKIAMHTLGTVIIDATFDEKYAAWFKQDYERVQLFGNSMFQAAAEDSITLSLAGISPSESIISPPENVFHIVIASIGAMGASSNGRTFEKVLLIYKSNLTLANLQLTIQDLQGVSLAELKKRIDDWKEANAVGNGINDENNIAKSASKTSLSVSILGGYSHKINHFILASEIGLDLGKTKIGDNSKNELEVKSNFNGFLVGRAGYEFYKMNTAYVNLGVSLRDVKVSFDGESKSKNMFNLVVGAGYEYSLNKKLGIFTEFNHITSLSSIKISEDVKLKVKSEQFKIGARYYFN